MRAPVRRYEDPSTRATVASAALVVEKSMVEYAAIICLISFMCRTVSAQVSKFIAISTYPALPANPWLEFHASISLVAYGAFALACIAGVMYLVQERQLKTHQLRSVFYHLPPLTDLFAAITRLLWWGFALYTLGIVSGFFTGHPLPRVQVVAAIGIWLLYAAILQGRHLRWLAPKRVAALCIIGFSAALVLLWGITFTSELNPTP